jgi:hypothetical protein
MISAFNHPNGRFNVFLLSTNAGGEGINLTAASRVVLLDVSWNPSRDQVRGCGFRRRTSTMRNSHRTAVPKNQVGKDIYGVIVPA